MMIATRVSCFLAIAMIATGCGDDDCCTGTTGGTSLQGTIECGSNTCTSGEVCVTYYAGVDAAVSDDGGVGGGWPGTCAQVPTLCAVDDCYGSECAPCLRQLCYDLTTTYVSGRQVSCGGA